MCQGTLWQLRLTLDWQPARTWGFQSHNQEELNLATDKPENGFFL